MSLRPHALLSTALILLLAAPPVGIQPLAQEQDQDQEAPPAQEPEVPATPDSTDEGVTSDDQEAARISDRLTIRAGFGGTAMRAGTRSDQRFLDGQTTEKTTQVNEMDFSSSTGGSFVAGVTYQLGKRWFVLGRFTTSGLGTDDFTDSRQFSNTGGPGETEYVRFTGQHESDYLDWAIGGAFRAFPTKRFKDSPFYVDAVLLFGATEADYTFNNGEVTSDDFNAPAFNPSNGFDTRGVEDASYNMDYQFLEAGVQFGGRLTERVALEGHFLPVWFGTYEGSADLGQHGTKLIHSGPAHKGPTDPTGLGFGELTSNDLHAPSVQVEQDSNRAKGLRVGINSYVTINDWLTLDFGFERNFLRALGGTEDRKYSDEDIADCPSPGLAIPGDPNSALPPSCPDDRDLDLLEAKLVSDTIYVIGRFRLY